MTIVICVESVTVGQYSSAELSHNFSMTLRTVYERTLP